jgi:hypothetical protein
MRSVLKLTLLVVGLALLWAAPAQAAQPVPPPQFDMTGFIQEATLDGTVAGAAVTPLPNTDPRAGGTMTINGIKMLIPNNTILQLPAGSFTWAQLLDPTVSAALPGNLLHQVPGQTMLALSDIPNPRFPPVRPPLVPPFPVCEVRAVGNVLPGPAGGPPRYIVGLIVPITQQGLNLGMGIVNYIDYATGRFRVGGTIGDPTSGALLEVNDPVGRYGLVHSPDPRFTCDTNNPTVHSVTGYPMGIPRVAPPAIDPLCPLTNRPLNGAVGFPIDPFLALGAPLRTFDMPAPGTAGATTNPTKQVPIMVGDWVDFSGTLCKINAAGPNIAANMYMSVHTLIVDVGVYTAPGVPPAYLAIEVILIGTGGTPPAGITQEATTRLRVEGFTTDPTGFIDVYAKDVNPITGQETLRLLGVTDPATQPVRGRFRHILNGGLFMPPTREIMVQSRTGVVRNVANGLDAGQYTAPQFDFIFPEHVVQGAPQVPANFEDILFLSLGSGPLGGPGSGGPIVGQLDPWPGDPVPPQATGTNGLAPVVSAGPNIAVGTGALVRLAGTVILDPNSNRPQIRWRQTGGPGVPLTAFNTLSPSFTAPIVLPGLPDQVLTFQLTVTDQFGSHSASMTVTVKAATDTVTIIAAIWRATAKGGTLTVNAQSTSAAAVLTADAFLAAGTVIPLGALAPAVPPRPGKAPVVGLVVNTTGTPQPATVVVRSSLGGSATVAVTIR